VLGQVAAIEHALVHQTGDVVVDLWGLAGCDPRIAAALNSGCAGLGSRARRAVLVNVSEGMREQLAVLERQGTAPGPKTATG
jgi:hypothetical protein